MIRTFLIPGLALLLWAGAADLWAQALTTVNFDSGGKLVFDQNTAATNPLTAGPAGDGNGAVLQLGYYSLASTADNFAGTWIPLTGETSANTATVPHSTETYNQTSIGDILFFGTANTPGTFAIRVDFKLGNATSGNNLPGSTTIPLALRFYNAQTIATSTFYNVVSDDDWLWTTPVIPPENFPIVISLDKTVPPLEWLSIAQGQPANTAFHTTISLAAVPEPATMATGLLTSAGVVFAAFRRRRRIASVQ